MEVHDDTIMLKGRQPVGNDPELNPVGVRKGRRFAYYLIEGPTEKADAPPP